MPRKMPEHILWLVYLIEQDNIVINIVESIVRHANLMEWTYIILFLVHDNSHSWREHKTVLCSEEFLCVCFL